MDSIEQALYAADAETSAIAAGRNPSERSHQANLSHSLREAIKLLAKERRKAQQELAAEREKVERLEAELEHARAGFVLADGEKQMFDDLLRLAEVDGCIAAAWAWQQLAPVYGVAAALNPDGE